MPTDFDQEIARLRRTHPEYVDFDGPYDAALVADVERTLGVRLPPSYREFLRRYGTLELSPNEIYGLTGTDRDRGVGQSGIPSTVRFTLDRRSRVGLPEPFVVIMDHDGVEYACLDTASVGADDECPVVTWNVPTRAVVSRAGASFDAYLRIMLESFEATLVDAG